MKQLVHTPNVKILSPQEVDNYAVEHVSSIINNKPHAVLILPTGSTPLGLYKLLVQAFKKREVDFSKATIFNLDEYWPIDPEHTTSYAYYMKHNLISHINIKPENWHIPNGAAKNAETAARKYEHIDYTQ